MLFSSEQAFQSLQELNVASIGCAEMPKLPEEFDRHQSGDSAGCMPVLTGQVCFCKRSPALALTAAGGRALTFIESTYWRCFDGRQCSENSYTKWALPWFRP